MTGSPAALDAAPAGTAAEGGSPCDCPRTEVGTMAGNSGHCAIHPLPGCPNPACGETWIKAFHGDHCDSCGWTAAPAGTTAEHPCTCGIHGTPHQRGTGPCILPAGRGPGRGRSATAGRRPAALLPVACTCASDQESPTRPALTPCTFCDHRPREGMLDLRTFEHEIGRVGGAHPYRSPPRGAHRCTLIHSPSALAEMPGDVHPSSSPNHLCDAARAMPSLYALRHPRLRHKWPCVVQAYAAVQAQRIHRLTHGPATSCRRPPSGPRLSVGRVLYCRGSPNERRRAWQSKRS
jgi:hypothetical protein